MIEADCSSQSIDARPHVAPDRVVVEPAISSWQVSHTPAQCQASSDHTDLIKRVNRLADRLGTAKLRCDQPLIVTGHQCGVWHPGILAKDIAASVAATKHGAAWLHIIVDQDANDSSTMSWPVLEQGMLTSKPISLWGVDASSEGVATGAMPAVDVADVVLRLERLAKEHDAGRLLDGLIDAWRKAGDRTCHSLADQWACVTASMLQPWCGATAVLRVSDLEGWGPYERLVDAMLQDARGCAKHYNDAVFREPGGGLSMLQVGREQVELPLWAIRDGQTRRKVWADLNDTQPAMVLNDGTCIDREKWRVLPRALTLTAAIRSASGVGVFIHGTGGGAYERVMERWINAWQPELKLATMAVVTADLRLQWQGMAIAERSDLAHALWRRHHLPHNIDRELNLESDIVREKRALLQHMDDDRDRKRRADAFRGIKAINEQLATEHADVIQAADDEVKRCRQGVKNRSIAQRRDWPIAAYDHAQLAGLVEAISA